jgi:diguanylate cyclase (GGDEF)-like protein
MLIDLDGLKQVNDTLGHEIGDRLIVDAARAITATLRDCDILGRLGGDEFCVFVKDQRDCDALAGRIRTAIQDWNDTDHPDRLSASIGAAAAQSANETLEMMLDRADEAMYLEKRSKKGAKI